MDNERLARLNAVIQTEATTSNKGDFFLTHAPFNNLSIGTSESITENQLLNDILLCGNGAKTRDDHQLIVIQGGSGSGKSHLIRWLKERYEAELAGDDSEVILPISRAHNNLKEAITALIKFPFFDDNCRKDITRALDSSIGSMSIDEFKELLDYKIVIAIEHDNDVPIGIDSFVLSSYLKNKYILQEFLMKDGGPLDKLLARADTVGNGVVDGDAPVFTPEDFAISYTQITQNLGGAEDYAIEMANDFASSTHGPKTRKAVADYLNKKVATVIRDSMGLSSVNFKKIFEDLRKDLKKKGKNLTLFIEDINAFTGIDNDLMEALIFNSKSEGEFGGNPDCCRLISVVGTTSWYYTNKLNTNIQQRITSNIFIRDNVLLNKDNVAKFAARYINAINLSDSQVNDWLNNGASYEEIPLAECKYSFSTVNIDGKEYSIFPFTELALKRLFNSLSKSEEGRTPRVFLNQILLYILTRWYSEGNGFLANESNFRNDRLLIPDWANTLYARKNMEYGVDNQTQRGLLFRIWGNGTTDLSQDTESGVTAEVFDAFGVPFPAGNKPPVAPPPINLPPINPPPPGIPPQLQELEVLLGYIDKWYSDTTAKLDGDSTLRDLLCSFIKNHFPWNEYGLTSKFESLVTRTNFVIDGQKSAVQGYLYKLDRNEETKYLLDALAYYKYAGQSSWRFPNGFDYLTVAVTWLEKHSDDIYAALVNSSNTNSLAEVEKLGLVAQVYNKLFTSGLDTSQTIPELAISLFSASDNQEASEEHSEAWKKYCNLLKSKQNLQEDVLSFFKKVVGVAGQSAAYTFVDADKLFNYLEELKNDHFVLSPMINVSSSSEFRATFASVIQSFQKTSEKMLNDEHQIVSNYLKSISSNFEAEPKKEDVSDTVSQMIGFLNFLDLHSSAYNAADGDKVKETDLSGRTYKVIADLTKADEGELDFGFLSTVSGDLLTRSSKIAEIFKKFNTLLDQKSQIFTSGNTAELQDKIDEYLVIGKGQINELKAFCKVLEGDDS